jgi:hypothetical protein
MRFLWKDHVFQLAATILSLRCVKRLSQNLDEGPAAAGTHAALVVYVSIGRRISGSLM